MITAEKFLLEIDQFSKTDIKNKHSIDYAVKQKMIEFAKMSVIEELKKHIEHPTKPGYRRLDIVKRIKELENE